MISFLSFIQGLLFVFTLHPLHISVTEIEFDEKDKRLEIMMRVFMDDLELTLRNKYQKPELDILNPGEVTLDHMMGDYLKDHFKISLDKKPYKTAYLGHEQDGEAFILYIEVSNIKKWKEIGILNDILTETHEDQSNLVHVMVRSKVRSLRLTKSNPYDKLTFDIK